MHRLTDQKAGTASLTGTTTDPDAPVLRVKSEDLLQQQRELEIDHHGRIYRLRLTQLNKLILTA